MSFEITPTNRQETGDHQSNNRKIAEESNEGPSNSITSEGAAHSRNVEQFPGVSTSHAQLQPDLATPPQNMQAGVLDEAGTSEASHGEVSAADERLSIGCAVKSEAQLPDSEESMRQIATLFGPRPEHNVDRTGKAGAEAGKAKPKKVAQPTDEEWLNQSCSRTLRVLKSSKCYKADAVLFRRMEKALLPFRASIEKAVLEAKLPQGNGGWFSTVYRLLKCRHPGDWLACGVCEGSGTDPDVKNPGGMDFCRYCAGGGYKMTLGD
jgi:hypothetical protein